MSVTSDADVADVTDYGGRPLVNKVLELGTMSVMWLVSVFGNCLVCIVIHRSRRLQSTTNYFVVSLAVADLLMAVLCMPFIFSRVVADEWVVGLAMCKMVRFLQWLVQFSSLSVLVSICIDRFYTIIYPLSFKVSRSGAKRMIFVSWLTGAILSGPTLYFYDIETVHERPYCRTFIGDRWDSFFYVIFASIVAFILPVAAITVGYVKVFRYIWKLGSGGRTFQRTMNSVPRAKVKMVKLIMVVNYVVVLIMSPYFFSHLWYSSEHPENLDPSVYLAVVWICYFNTATKPCIYLLFNSNFRRGVKEVFCMSSMKCYRSNAYTITTASKFGKNNHIGVDPSGTRRIDSPSKTFDRAAMNERVAWPIANPSPSSYL